MESEVLQELSFTFTSICKQHEAVMFKACGQKVHIERRLCKKWHGELSKGKNNYDYVTVQKNIKNRANKKKLQQERKKFLQLKGLRTSSMK